MSKATVLICDDNIAVHDGLTVYLHEDDIAVISVYDGESALAKIRSEGIDLVILDIMLPNMSGIEVCREIRKSSDIPIIILSAKSEELDRIVGLQLGADDYVTKPFSPREVVIRAQTILRRLQITKENTALHFAELRVFLESYEVYVDGNPVDLTAKETELLSYLIDNAGKVLSRERILHAVWDYDYCGDTRAVDAQIKRLRQKLPAGKGYSIRTVYGVGYKLEAAK